jgi:hypothetical protein
MSDLVEFALEDGSTVVVQVEQTPAASSGGTTRGLRDTPAQVGEKAATSFEGAVDRIRPIADALISRLRDLERSPDEIQVEFGMNLHAELGAFVAAASTDANFKLSLTWRRDDEAAGSKAR